MVDNLVTNIKNEAKFENMINLFQNNETDVQLLRRTETIPAIAASSIFSIYRNKLAKETKGRRNTLPLTNGYIDDVDRVIYNQNPRQSVDSIEFLKILERLPQNDKLAYEAARKVRSSLTYAFPNKVTISKNELLDNVTSCLLSIHNTDNSVIEFSHNSRFSRTDECNTIEYNTRVINNHIDKFKAFDYRILSHDYKSSDQFGYLPKVKVFSTANGNLNLDNHICTRRAQLNGESHFIIKYGENGALPGSGNTDFLYSKLTNRLSLFSNKENEIENIAVSYNLDPRNIRSLFLRDVDIVFHDFNGTSVELYINTKKLAKYFEDHNYIGQYAFIYLDELIREDIILAMWASSTSKNCIIDIINNRQYKIIDSDSANATSFWHIANIDNAKRHYCKIGSKCSFTAYSGVNLAELINSSLGEVKYGTMIKAIFENEQSGRLEAWLNSPLLRELYETHDYELFKKMQKEIGKLHTVNIKIEGKKVPALVSSFDFLDIEKENELALLFSTYFLMIEQKNLLERQKTKENVVQIVEELHEVLEERDFAKTYDDVYAQALVKSFVYTEMPISFMEFGFENHFYKHFPLDVYSSSDTSFQTYLDNYLYLNHYKKSRMEITNLHDGSVHIMIKGNSFNNNYNEEFVISYKNNTLLFNKPSMVYEFSKSSSYRDLGDPTKLNIINRYSNDLTKTLFDIEEIFEYFGKEIQTHNRTFY